MDRTDNLAGLQKLRLAGLQKLRRAVALTTRFLCVSFVFLVRLGSTEASQDPAPNFVRDVRPILSSVCFRCHGPDEETREAGLRLDQQSGMFGTGTNGRIVVPGHPEQSDLLRRIESHDDEIRMPPPSSTRMLTDLQREVLRNWIASGAAWEDHWAFLPPTRPNIPSLPSTWDRMATNEIDHFIAEQLERNGLTPSPQEPTATLVRRLYLDLIGLPPTVSEADQWMAKLGNVVSDESMGAPWNEDAYRDLVEHLLNRPEYGERWARKWLDLARYADSNGYEKDRPRSIWPYRDWVVDVINRDMPFDQFTIEQIAGDLLPNPTRSQLVATGFHRNTMLNEEGGIDPLEFRFHAMTDRVATTGTTWLGLTLGCAQCHTHKYDPVSHADYYRLMAFMNNADEPELILEPPDYSELAQRNREEAQRRLAELPDKWAVESLLRLPIRMTAASATGGETLTLLENSSASGTTTSDANHLAPGVKVSGPASAQTDYVVDVQITRSDFLQADTIRLVTETPEKQKGPGRTPHGNFVLNEFLVSVVASDGQEIQLGLLEGHASVEQNGYPIALATDGNPATGWAINADGFVPKTATAEWKLADLPAIEESQADVLFRIRLRQNYGERHNIGQFRIEIGRRRSSEELQDLRNVEILARFDQWLDKMKPNAVNWKSLAARQLQSNMAHLESLPDQSILASGDITKQDWYEIQFEPVSETIRALQLEVLPDSSLPGRGPGLTFYEGRAGDFFLNEFSVRADGQSIPLTSATHSYARNQFGNTPVGADLTLDGDVQTGWTVFGRTGERHTAVYHLKEAIAAGQPLTIRMTFGRHFACSLGRFRIRYISDETSGEMLPQAVGISDDVLALLRRDPGSWGDADAKLVFEQFLLQAPELASEADSIQSLLKPPAAPTTLIFRERPASNRRRTHVHHRGEYLQPKHEVEPAVLSALHPMPENGPSNRLGFARWLVDRRNPLTARVVVNRHWAAFFGRGIVATLDDFGVQAAVPSHPELLDWLAVTLMDDDQWSMKALHRRIVMSQTYRQSSVRPEGVETIDPENMYLSYSSRHRLDAEVVRDSILKAAGVLSEVRGGPPVFPLQPPGITEVAFGSPGWSVSNGEARYRRSLYTMIKRTAPFAMILTFDGLSGEACVAKRTRSNSPLQALTLLNDVMFVDLARAAGRRHAELLTARVETGLASQDADRLEIVLLFREILTRVPDEAEQQALMEFVAKRRTEFLADPQAARMLLGDDAKDAASGGVSDLTLEAAVWTSLARAVYALDESVTRP